MTHNQPFEPTPGSAHQVCCRFGGGAAQRQRYMAIKPTFIHLLCLITISLSGGINWGNAAEKPACIPAQEADIDGYIPGQDRRVISDKVKPLGIRNEQGEDDGGVYTATILKYPHYEIVIVRDAIDAIRTRASRLTWARGVKIGDTRSQVDNRIGYAKVSDEKDEAQYLVCSDAGDVYAILRFSTGNLADIEVVIDRP